MKPRINHGLSAALAASSLTGGLLALSDSDYSQTPPTVFTPLPDHRYEMEFSDSDCVEIYAEEFRRFGLLPSPSGICVSRMNLNQRQKRKNVRRRMAAGVKRK